MCHPRLGLPPIGLHWTKDPRHRAIRRRKQRRRSGQAPHHDGHRPRRGTGDPPNVTHRHQSTRPTLRTTCAMDRNHADPNLAIAATTGASISRSRPVGLRYAAGSVESVQQPGAPPVHPLCHPARQRSRTRVLGLDGRAEPLSDNDGRRGAALRKGNKRVQFDTGGGHQEEEQEGEC
jgi:hypothetical protein